MVVESSGDIYALSEDCIANVLSLTSPKDACRLSAIASTFHAASQSDTVWDRFLPSDYLEIISRAVDGPDSLLEFRSKKDLYLQLCDHPILIDDGRKSFWLDKLSGKKCYMVAARELSIVWGDTPQYWQWISLSQSRFAEVAELLDVCWLEIRGEINTNMLSSSTNYAAYLVFTCQSMTYGFSSHTAEGSVSMNGHGSEKRSFYLIPQEEQEQRSPGLQRQLQDNSAVERNTEYPKERKDGWMEVELGEYFVNGGQDGDLQVSLTMLTGNWKRGIIIQGIEIRPRE